MVESGPATRLTILLKDNDQWHHRPLFTEIVHRAHEAGLAGASVFHGIEGFGRSQRIHTSRILSLADDLPCCVLIVDSEEQIRAFLPQIEELVADRLVTLEPVDVVAFPSPAR